MKEITEGLTTKISIGSVIVYMRDEKLRTELDVAIVELEC